MNYRLITFVAAILITSTIYSQQIVRRASLGVKLKTANDSVLKANSITQGVSVIEIANHDFAKLHKLKKGDVLLSADGNQLSKSSEVISYLKTKRSGDVISFNIIRNNKRKIIKSKLPAAPKEKSDDHDIIYDQFTFNQGSIRVIVDKPRTKEKVPAILFIQGYTCGSLDNRGENHPYIKLAKSLCEKGYAVMRMEKSGEGDNVNTPPCESIDFHTEVETFALALEKLKSYDFVDKDNVFIWGHSMGGIIAPIIASQQKVKGVAVYGCTITPWRDYVNDLFRVQSIISGADPVENEKGMKTYADVIHKLFIEKQSPMEIAKDSIMNEALVNGFGYDGNGHLWTRNYKYMIQIDDYNLFEMWSKVTGDVLVFWGDADIEAFSEWDHKQIADVVNKYHPGKGTYYNIKNTTHAFAKVESMQHGLENRDWNYITTHFNNEVVDVTNQWMQKIINQK